MATAIVIPAAPGHLSIGTAAKWQSTYKKALAQAQNDIPNNPSAQRNAALKAANALLAVTAPTSAAEIDKLEEWQVLDRKTLTAKDGTQSRVCVTADGRKYSFPIVSAPASSSQALQGAKV